MNIFNKKAKSVFIPIMFEKNNLNKVVKALGAMSTCFINGA